MTLHPPGGFVPLLLTAALMGGWAGNGSAQASSGREILALDLTEAASASVPAGLRLLGGSVAVVVRDGLRMLKASTPTEFLVTLPEVLPQDFTLEIDIVPKQCCNPEDLAVEGTPTLSRSSSSAQILWHRNSQNVMGGGPPYQAATPADLQESTPGQLTRIVISVEGETVKLYTNGKRLYTLTERRFARGRVLRVFLGGQDEGEQAVYLAKLRVVAGAATVVATTTGQSASTGTLVQPGGTIRAAGTGPAPATVSGVPTAAPRPSAGATATGPVATTSANNPVTDTRLALFAPPPPRSIRLTGFAGDGVSQPPGRRIRLTGFAGEGAPPASLARTIRLSGYAGVGGWEVPSPRAIRLTGYAGVGNARDLSTSFRTGITEFPAPDSRRFLLPAFTGIGNNELVASRSIRLAAFAGTGEAAFPPSRKITLPGFAGAGAAGDLVPQRIRLPGWVGVGPITTP